MLALVASLGLWLLSFVLTLQAFLHLQSVWLLYGVVAVQSACFAVNNPARSAIIPRLLPAAMLPAANALSSASFNVGFTVGPLLGGVVYGWGGAAAAYSVDCFTFTAALYSLWRLPPVPPIGAVRRAGLSSVIEGLRFLRTRPNVLMTFLVDMCAMVLAQPRALFPAMAMPFFGGGTRTVGLLAASPAIGALLAFSMSGWVGRIRRQGLAVMLSVVAYGAVIAGLGFTRLLWLAVVLLALSGAADMVSSVYRNTILQVATPDEMRGRLAGVFIVVVAGGPRLGDFTAGSVASLSTESFAVVAGGCSCIVGVVLLGLRYRGFARYDARHPVP
jgi:MFS family permease